MKNLSLILNIVLIIAVGVLYFLYFSGGNEIQKADGEPLHKTAAGSLKIGYVNSDSLLANYKFFEDKADELEKEKKKMESDLNNRAKGLENEFADFQKTAGNLTINQARALEEDLMKKRQNLMQYQENLGQVLLRKETEVNNIVYEKVSEFLKDYGQKNDLKIVLSYTRGSGVLFAHDSLNITQVVITGLNSAYQNEKTMAVDTAKVQ